MSTPSIGGLMPGLAGMPDNNSGITGHGIGGMQPLPLPGSPNTIHFARR
jgi:hypothetical protein